MAVKKTITYRWLVYGFSLIAAVLVIAAILLVAVLRNYYYQSAEEALTRCATLYRRSVVLTEEHSGTWERTASAYIENFENKEQIELQVLSAHGTILASSIGFAEEGDAPVGDFKAASAAVDKSVTRESRNRAGEHVLALTTVQTDEDGTVIGALRYVVSLQLLDRQLLLYGILIGAVVLLILFFTALSGSYFIRSIVHPVEEIGRAARRIAKGDYAYRVEKHSQDEIGELCDTINYMAGEIQHAEQLKNDFIFSVSHELRTPLTAIRGWSETLQQAGAEDPALLERGMRIITEETGRLSDMVEELLDFSRMQSGKLVMRFEPLDLTAIVEETVFLFRKRAENKGVFLHNAGDGKLPEISGDADRLRQVLINVLDNAIKYSDTGDTVRVDYAPIGQTVQVVIGDSGSGIPHADLPLVKMKFYKANHTRPGSGIGLAVADEIVTAHGGTLELHSKEGVGTSVMITLPISQN